MAIQTTQQTSGRMTTGGWLQKQAIRGTISVMLAGAALFPSVGLAAAPTSGFAVITSNSVHIRKSPSTNGESLGYMSQGDVVRVLWEEGEYRRVSFGSLEGYVHQDFMDKAARAGADKATSSASGVNVSGVVKKGDKGNAVKEIQNLLIKKGYLFSEATGEFGEMTEQAVRDFQRMNDLTVDGMVGGDTLKLLQAYMDSDSEADEKPQGSTNVSIREGDKGEEVANMQKALRNKGYYEGSIDGDFGKVTLAALKDFQKVNGLTVDGASGPATMGLLYGEGKNKPVSKTTTTASKAKTEQSKEQTSQKVAQSSGAVKNMDWFDSSIQEIFPRGKEVTVIDTGTGLSFNVKRKGGTNHADVEPLTADDTAIMKEIRGSWSWDRRPLVVIIDGQMIAASWNGMPHGGSSISGNNFSGHFCIHFKNSRTHGGNKLDKLHQAAVEKALSFGQ